MMSIRFVKVCDNPKCKKEGIVKNPFNGEIPRGWDRAHSLLLCERCYRVYQEMQEPLVPNIREVSSPPSTSYTRVAEDPKPLKISYYKLGGNAGNEGSAYIGDYSPGGSGGVCTSLVKAIYVGTKENVE